MNPILKRINNQGENLKDLQRKVHNIRSKYNPEEVNEDEFVLCDNLVKIYKRNNLEVMALQGLDLKIKKAELIGIIGSSGSGKSTLLGILGGFIKPTAGKVMIAGWDISKLSHQDRIKYKRTVVGFVWQNTMKNLVPYFTIKENILLPMFLAGNQPDLEWLNQLLEAVDLGKRLNSNPMELSGGQRQRVAIAVALANKPEILLADEPTGALDSKTAAELFKVFKHVTELFRTTVIVVTHDRSLASSVARVVEIRDGKISTESVRNTERVIKDYSFELLDGFGSGETHEHYSVLDKAGRVQLPEEYLEEMAVSNRVKIKMEDGNIIISSDKNDEK